MLVENYINNKWASILKKKYLINFLKDEPCGTQISLNGLFKDYNDKKFQIGFNKK